MAKKATAKANKQCPMCKMEVDAGAETCPGCAAVFDNSPRGASVPEPEPDDENGDDENSE